MPDTAPTINQALDRLLAKSKSVNLPSGLTDKLTDLFSQLQINANSPDTFWQSYQITSKYLDWLVTLPWDHATSDILDINHASQELNKNHYGLDTAKERILEFISVLALQNHRHPESKPRSPVLLFTGLVGTGKTTLAKSIASALGRQFIRIPFGGLGDPLYLRGRSRIYPEAEPGAIIKGLASVNSNNPVILLDEIDRVADDSLNTIMGVLVELLDPEQNHRFVDHYLDYPFDLSNCLFCATCNNTTRIATAVMDRLEVIQMPSYTDEEKIVIGRDYILPRAIKDSGLNPDEISIADNIWPNIVRPLGFDAGVRTLKRNIEGMCQKVARQILSGQAQKVVLDDSNIKYFIPQW